MPPESTHVHAQPENGQFEANEGAGASFAPPAFQLMASSASPPAGAAAPIQRVAELTEEQVAAALAFNNGRNLERASIRLLQNTLGCAGTGTFDAATVRALAIFSQTKRLEALNTRLEAARNVQANRAEVENRIGPPTEAEAEMLNTDTAAAITELEGQVEQTTNNFNGTDGHLTRETFNALFDQMVVHNLHSQAIPLAIDYLNINQDNLVQVQLDGEAANTWRIEVPFSNLSLDSTAAGGANLTDAPNQLKKVFLGAAAFASTTAFQTAVNAVNGITYQSSTTEGAEVEVAEGEVANETTSDNPTTLTAAQSTAAISHNQFLFDQARAVNVIQGFLESPQTGTLDAASCQAISNYQQSNSIARTDGRLDHATLDHMIRAMITAGEREAVLLVAADFYNLNEFANDVLLSVDAEVAGVPESNAEIEGISSFGLGDTAFANGLNGLGEALDSAMGNGTSMNDESLDAVLAGTNTERRAAMWSNPDQANEDGLAVFVRENFPSEEDLGRFLARTDVTDAAKIEAIGQIQIEIGRLEYLLGVLYLGGNTQSWENLAPANTNRGTFVNHYKAEVGNGANNQPWCTMFSGYLKRMTGFEEDLSTGGPLIFNAGARLDHWATEGRNYISGVDDFSDPSDFENYTGASIDRADWVGLRQNVNANGTTQAQKQQHIDDFFADRVTPQAGDIVIINTGTTTNNYSGSSSHTVTVESYSDYTISTIEGNRGPHRLTGVEIDLRDATDVAQVICLVRAGTEFYTENDVPEAAPVEEGQEAEVVADVSSEDILTPLRHMVRNLQLMAGRRNYVGDTNAGATVSDMSGAVAAGTQ